MEQAYAALSGVYRSGDSLFIAGTRTAKEWVDDLTLPLGPLAEAFGLPVGVTTFPRFKAAEKQLKPGVARLVGHSMGGTVALALAQKHDLAATTYAAPVFVASAVNHSSRYRDTLDPVSMFDGGAENVGLRVPHSAGLSAGRESRW